MTHKIVLTLGLLGLAAPASASTCDELPETVYFDGACRVAGFFDAMAQPSGHLLRVDGSAGDAGVNHVVLTELAPGGVTVSVVSDGAPSPGAPAVLGYPLERRHRQTLSSDAPGPWVHRTVVGELGAGGWSTTATIDTWFTPDDLQACDPQGCTTVSSAGGGEPGALTAAIAQDASDAISELVEAWVGLGHRLLGPQAASVGAGPGDAPPAELQAMLLLFLLWPSDIACDHLVTTTTSTNIGPPDMLGFCYEQEVTTTIETLPDCTTTTTTTYGPATVVPCMTP